MTSTKSAQIAMSRRLILPLILAAWVAVPGQVMAAVVMFEYTGNPMDASHPRATGPPFAVDDFITAKISVDDTSVGTSGAVTPSYVLMSINNAAGMIFSIDTNTPTTFAPTTTVDFLGNAIPTSWVLSLQADVFDDTGREILTSQSPTAGNNGADAAFVIRTDGTVDSNHRHAPFGSWTMVPLSEPPVSGSSGVPEPTSFIIWGTLACAILASRKRRDG